ncbi:TlpA family protein disulfide reductase [Flavivirga jejuensis]|uniref:TlpA disulfide reductase family protein n=1 Tax=Flavivirga jejuensis TaxID=870487 RepID=A0ABT8WKZ9_9FLAO|nr:TlpA disulfide reductase family protein [Flavivirga jejuensis]MDO5973793.1 TlpA disulfide reductase family protein [Flavivirga jejuensis]
MKKTILSLALVLSLIACKKETPVDYALFSAKIENYKSRQITLTKVESLKKKILRDTNGVFLDTIKNNEGLYLLKAGKNSVNIYLNNGNDINLTADSKDFNNSLKISGKGAGTTNYLLLKNKTKIQKADEEALYVLEEGEFKNKVKNISTLLNTALDTMEGIDPAFKALEKRKNNYNYLLELSKYATGKHLYWTKKNDYEPSEGFLAELKTLDVNNEADFMSFNTYKQLVTAHYIDEIKDLSKKDSISFMLAKLKIHGAIPNKTIKNELIFTGAEYGMRKADDVEAYYQIFMKASTNAENNAKITKVYNELKVISKGQPSPKFANYEKHSGGTLSLDDLKGQYVYIDVWATWCVPCIKEIPDLKRVEKAYHGKNIVFLSISIDEAKNHDKWKTMVKNKDLGGIQVIADKGGKSQFLEDYFISSIPRFILLDPEGKIVSSKAPRPSNPELIDLFNELNI